MRERFWRWWSLTVEDDTPEGEARGRYDDKWQVRLNTAVGRLNSVGQDGAELETGSWDSLRNRSFTLSASALGLSFLTLQIDKPKEPDLIPWDVLLWSIGLLLASMTADWATRYLVRMITVALRFADRLGNLSGHIGPMAAGGRTLRAVPLAWVVIWAAWVPHLIKFLEKPAGIIGMVLVIFAAVRLIEFARANV